MDIYVQLDKYKLDYLERVTVLGSNIQQNTIQMVVRVQIYHSKILLYIFSNRFLRYFLNLKKMSLLGKVEAQMTPLNSSIQLGKYHLHLSLSAA